MFEWSIQVLIVVFLILGSIWFLGHYLLVDDVVYIQGRQRHSWKSIKILDRGCYCSVCEICMSSLGLFCDHCGVCSDNGCIKKAEKTFKCKEKYAKDGKPFKHLWVKGNLPLNCECYICNVDIDYHSEPGLYGWRCCYCQRTTHNKCFAKVDELCDFGPFRDMIIPPSSIIASKRRAQSRLFLQSIVPPEWTDWKPLIVIANVKSGSSAASDIISLFRGILHPSQVIEMCSRNGPHDALQWALKISPNQCRILVAGGDGSIVWVLTTIFMMNIKPVPEVCILPLGTGNDLSRVLGWGAEPTSIVDPVDILKKIQRAEPVKLDRWLLEIQGFPSRIPLKRPMQRNLLMYNYFSVGVDAQVTLNFHKARESQFYMMSSRVINKLLYLCFGTHQVVQPDCVGLENCVELYLDGVKIALPKLQSIVLLNIDSWGAGVRLWEMSKTDADEPASSPSDGTLEVLGIVSSFHIAQLQVGLNQPIRLGQAKSVQIKIKKTFPVQVDGEPWQQPPCEIKIKRTDQALVLKRNS